MNEQRVWAEVDLDHIAHNIVQIRNHIPQPVKIMAVVKADGYGHGAVETAKVLLYHGADAIGVAICDEGIALRENHIFVPILVLGFTPEPRFDDMIRHDLTQTVFSLDMARALSRAAVRLGKKVRIHIKVDTGMSRLGFLPTETAAKEIEEITRLPQLVAEGIYTHFATSDSLDKSFTEEQFERFVRFMEVLEGRGVRIPVRHVSNSGALKDCPSMNMDMVRTGILLYGHAPAVEVGTGPLSLLPAMSLKTRVSMVKKIDADVSVSYGRTFYTNRKTTVATVPVGYADGYFRGLNRGGRVLVGGGSAPIIGNICMDQFMIDITDIPNVRAGDEIVLMGRQGDSEITADELAAILHTISYEILCGVGKRVPRVYIKDGVFLKKVDFFS